MTKKKAAKIGRPTKLDDALTKKFLQAIRGGNYRHIAAQWAGIAPETLSRWLERGEAGEAPFAVFRQAVLEAEAEAHVRAVATIQKHGVTDPKELRWWLARKFPKEWAEKSTLKLEGSADGSPVTIQMVDALKAPKPSEDGDE